MLAELIPDTDNNKKRKRSSNNDNKAIKTSNRSSSNNNKKVAIRRHDTSKLPRIETSNKTVPNPLSLVKTKLDFDEE